LNPPINKCWADRPRIGINDHDLFITVNLFRDSTYKDSTHLPATLHSTYLQTMLLQIAKDSGYKNAPTPLKIWPNFGNKILMTQGTVITPVVDILPVSHGQGKTYGPKMYFIATQEQHPINGYELYVFKIDSAVYQYPKNFTSKTVSVQEPFNTPIAVKQGNLGIDLLDAGDCRIMKGFYMNNRIHAVFGTKRIIAGLEQNGVQYVRVNVANNSVIDTAIYSTSNVTHFCYPAIASSGLDTTSMQATITYLYAGDTSYASIGAINVNYPVKWR
jgi:hypothetical protein